MVSGISKGFILPKMQSIVIKSDDMQKYGIKPEDWAKVDKNEDGLITADEFITNGMSIGSIFNAYRTLAMSHDAYVNPSQESQMNTNPQGNMFANNSNMQYGQNPYGSYNLNHPNVTGSGLGNTHDFMA